MYSVKYSCSNCNHDFNKDFQKGKKAPSAVTCPNCGCLTGLKVWPALDLDERTVQPWPFPCCPYPHYYPRPEPIKPLWEWPKYDHKTTCVQWQDLLSVYGGT